MPDADTDAYFCLWVLNVAVSAILTAGYCGGEHI
jgi:hypothetical protein